MYEPIVTCPKCQSDRSPDLKTPCRTCGARSTIFGYLYENEFNPLKWATITIAIVIFLACISGVIFLVFQSLVLTK